MPFCVAVLVRGSYFGYTSECNEFLGCRAALLCGAFRKGMEFPVSLVSSQNVMLRWSSCTACLGVGCFDCVTSRLGPLWDVLSAWVVSPGSVWFITTLSPALLLLSQSHAEVASRANKTFRHRAVCIIRLMIESMLDFIDSSFQSNIGALLEHSTVW